MQGSVGSSLVGSYGFHLRNLVVLLFHAQRKSSVRVANMYHELVWAERMKVGYIHVMCHELFGTSVAIIYIYIYTHIFNILV